ncbi:MAG: outer membrane lipoprotein chaperone LolA [Deltaproteobacteria bacterium]|nr:outer membrane lipoprotein chaperone LolA [Deltaproteobacteria bacterium]
MKNLFLILIMFLTIMALPNIAWVENNKDLDWVLTQVQDNYEKMNDFRSEFTQEATVRTLNQVQKAEGEVWFKKPGKMRWNYYRPTRDVIVSDGRTIWFYNHEEKQVIESRLAEVVDTPTTTTFLSGLGNIKKQFNARFSETSFPDENGNYLIDLTPKENSNDEEYNKVTIAVDKNMLVKTIYLYDPFGNLTRVKLEDIEINKGVPDSLFKFDVPKGAEVIKTPSAD